MPSDFHIAARDPRIDLKDSSLIRVVNDGPSSSTYQNFPATNQSSITSTIYQINPPSTKTGLGRYVRQRIQGQAIFTGTNLSAANCRFALRPWPLATCMSSCNMQINNANIAYSQQNSFIPAFSKVCNPVINQTTFQSGTATAPDIVNNYADIIDSVASPFESSTDIPNGTVARPRTDQITGIYFTTPAETTGINTAFVNFTITEPILLAPFSADSNQVEALYNVSQLNITINWATLWKMFSVGLVKGGTATITDFNITFADQTLLLNYVSIHDDSMTTPMYEQIYNCPNIQLYTNTVNSVVNAPTDAVYTPAVVGPPAVPAKYSNYNMTSITNLTTNTITLPRCPRLAIIWISDVNSYSLSDLQSCTRPDRMYPITSCSVNCYDKSSLLAGSTVEQLYEMSVAAGLNATQAQFMGLPITGQVPGDGPSPPNFYATNNGCPLVIDFANLSLPPGIAPGVDIQTQLQFNLGAANNLFGSGDTANQAIAGGVQINLLLITDGYLINSPNGSSEWRVGGMQPSDVKNAKNSSRSQYHAIMHRQTETTLLGGSFWDTLKNIGRSVLSVATPIVSAVAPELAAPLSMVSSLAGAGKIHKAAAKRAASRGYY